MDTATLPTSAAADLLNRSTMSDLWALDVNESEAEVVITGRVRSFFLKQMAQEAVRPALGCRRLLNRVVVGRN